MLIQFRSLTSLISREVLVGFYWSDITVCTGNPLILKYQTYGENTIVCDSSALYIHKMICLNDTSIQEIWISKSWYQVILILKKMPPPITELGIISVLNISRWKECPNKIYIGLHGNLLSVLINFWDEMHIYRVLQCVISIILYCTLLDLLDASSDHTCWRCGVW